MAEKEMGIPSGKRGQVTLFIIVGILIVSVILVFFLWIQPTYLSKGGGRIGFENCVSDVVEEGVSELGLTSGFLRPELTYSYQGNELTYLCYTNQYYETCTVQKPFLKQNFEEQISLRVKDQIEFCYSSSLDELRAKGYGVTAGEIKYNILLEPGVVRVDVNAPTTVGAQSFKKFSIPITSPIYEMIMMATSIIQSETHYGDFDTSKMMILYPEYSIQKLKQGDGTTLYIIESKLFKNKLQFASRSLVLPPGNLP